MSSERIDRNVRIVMSGVDETGPAAKSAVANMERVAAAEKNAVKQSAREVQAARQRGPAAIRPSGGDEESGGFDSLKESFGKNSTLGNTLKMFKGAGAIGAIGLGVGMIDHIASSMIAARDASTWLERTDAKVKAVPLFGDAVVNLSELMSGQRAHAKKEAETVAFGAKQWASTRDLMQEKQLSGLKGADREIKAILFKQANAEEEAVKELTESRKGKSEAQKRKLVSDAGENRQARAVKADTDIENIRAEANYKERVDVLSHNESLRQMEQAAAAQRFRDAGQHADADLVEIRSNLQAQRAALDADARQRLHETTNVEEQKRIIERGKGKLAAVELKGSADVARAEEEGQLSRLKVERDWNDKYLAIVAQNAQAELVLRGKTYDAVIVDLQAAKDRERTVVLRAMEEKVRISAKDPDFRRGLVGTALAQAQGYLAAGAGDANSDAKIRLTDRAGVFARDDRSREIQSQAIRIRIEGLRQEAELGNGIAAREAERLQLAQATAEARGAILQRLDRERDLTDAERTNLRGQANEIARQGAVGQLLMSSRDPSRMGRPTFLGGAFVEGGVGNEGFRPSDQAAADKEQLKTLNQMLETLGRVADATEKVAGMNIDFVSVFGGGPGQD